ncbi:MAG: PAS domain-containing protein [Candidatus Kaistia colombiensis]|nr:MAG: PAS domain-containing protein [Kaistia sp.]
MRHSSTQQLHAYWLRQRGGSPAPLRRAIEPAPIASVLGDMFILGVSEPDTSLFRLAGTRLCANLGRELTGTNFLSLWRGADRDGIGTVLHKITRDAAAAVLDITGQTERGNTLAAEMLLLPVSQNGQHIDRVLGLLAPLERPYWLGLHAIPHLEAATGLRWLQQDETPSARPSRTDRPLAMTSPPPMRQTTVSSPPHPTGRRHQHLVVLDGGRD